MPDSDAPGAGHNSAPLEAVVEKLTAAATRSAELAAEKKTLEARAKAISKEMEKLARSTLPELLAEIGATKWETEDFVVAVGAKVAGSLSRSSDPDKAVEALRANGMGSAIRSTLTVSFEGDEHDLCEKVAQTIAAHFEREVSTERTIHPSTLAAWARDRIKEGQPVDFDLFGLATWREATVKER